MKTGSKYSVTATVAAPSVSEDVRNFSARRRNLLHLMHRYLLENGYYSCAEMVKTEARLSEEYELCDNVDLDSIYLEYVSFFQLKFGKYPKILKRTGPAAKLKLELHNGKGKAQQQHQHQHQQKAPTQERGGAQTLSSWQAGGGAGTSVAAGSGSTAEPEQLNADGLQLHVRKLDTSEAAAGGSMLTEIEHGHAADDALFSSLDWQALAELVKTTIMREDCRLRWLDVCGNQNAIELIKEAVITPIEYPQLFAHGLKPWRSLLLHGPPGSGKTYLAKVLYAETQRQVTFFNITASILVSKWRGESEKILRVLFHMAARQAPSVIFFDEIESLTSKRDRCTDHESSKRFKNELLQLLDGMEHQLNGVFVLASTNLPWDIDEAFLRRFEKKLLVQLPTATERGNLIAKLLGSSISLTAKLLEQLVELSEHFTGDEIRLACKEISMQSVRRATKRAGAQEANKETQAWQLQQLEKAFKQVKPLGQRLLAKHEQWQLNNGT